MNYTQHIRGEPVAYCMTFFKIQISRQVYYLLSLQRRLLDDQSIRVMIRQDGLMDCRVLEIITTDRIHAEEQLLMEGCAPNNLHTET